MNSKGILAAAFAAISGLSTANAADLPNTKSPPPMASPAPFFFVNDNVISLSYQFTATDPGYFDAKGSAFGKSVVNFTHFDVWGYGTNFFTIDLLKSGSKDAATPCLGPGPGCTGSTEIYGLFRSTLGFNELFHTKAFSFGPLTDISFEFGADANTQNNFVAPAKRDVVAGLQFSFALPYKGHLNISPLAYKEWNHNSFLTPLFTPFGPADGNTSFDTTWDVETNYAMDLGFLPEAFPLTFSGYANFHGPKGRGGISGLVPLAAVAQTAVEFNSEQKLSLDVSKMAFGSNYSHFFDVWVAYRYWQNKFGLDHTKSPVCVGNSSCTESSWVSGVSVKF
jgi:hypothetical protein